MSGPTPPTTVTATSTPPPVSTPNRSPTGSLDLTAYLSEATRLATFVDWPHAHPSGALLSVAGFFFADGPAPDEVACPSCKANHSDFTTGRDVWDILSHRRDCTLRAKIGEAKNRSCTECHEVFATIGSKLNHCKRVHPKSEEERRIKREAKEKLGAGNRKKVVKVRAGGKTKSTWNEGDKGRMLALATQNMEVESESEEAEGDLMEWGEKAGLSFSSIMLVVDCEPSVRAGEVVMSRAEYRGFRQHFRFMTRIFKDMDPKHG